MTTQDYEHIAIEIAGKLRAKLLATGELAERRPDSPQMVVAITKVLNLTSDIMSEGTKWYLMARVKNSLPFATLSREKNIRFVISADHLRLARQRGTVEENFAFERQPTHVMTATFSSVTRAVGVDRTDLYYCEYSITALKTGELVWVDKVEFKRTAHGRAWD
jgi:hypothetical protein